MLLAILLTGALVLYQRSVVRRTGSIAIRADSLHYRGDLLMNLAVIVALVLTELTGSPLIDPLVRARDRRGAAVRRGRGRPPGARHADGPRAAGGQAGPHPRAGARPPGRAGRARPAHAPRRRRRLHRAAPGARGRVAARAAHDITHEVEARIREAFPDADIIVHQEPAGLEDERLDHKIAAVEP